VKVKILNILLILVIVSCVRQSGKQDNPAFSNNQIDQSTASNNEVENVDLILKQYDSPTRDYWQNPDLVVDKMGNLDGKVVADIGVGTGYFTFRLAPDAEKIIAIDVENRFLEYIEDRKFELGDNSITRKIETRLCKADDPMLKHEEVDLVLLVNTYHFIDDRLDYLVKIHKGIKPLGEVILVDFKLGEMPVGPSESVKIKKELAIAELKNAGFEIVEIDTSGLQFQYIIKAKKI